MKTRLLYLENMSCLTGQAQIQNIIHEHDNAQLVLDQTVFYPQGGGQPSDQGIMQGDGAFFQVHKVTQDQESGIVYHTGVVQTGAFAIGQQVALQVDPVLRALHNRNHTAGHLIDYALYNLGYTWAPTKAYHFPQGPYVEYAATLDQDIREKLVKELEQAVNVLVQQALPVTITLLDNNPEQRAMVVDTYQPILCGGTHVVNTRDIGHITIRKIKNEKGNLRVSYAIS